MPQLNSALFSYLLEKAGDYEVLVPVRESRYEPLAALYRRSVIPVAERNIAMEDFKMLHTIKQTKHLEVAMSDTLPFYHPGLFANINRPEDLK